MRTHYYIESAHELLELLRDMATIGGALLAVYLFVWLVM